MSNTSLLGSFGGQAGDALMFRNRIINGDMRISQRGTSFVSPANVYTLDRFLHASVSSATLTINQSSDVPNSAFSNSLHVDVTATDTAIAAGDFVSIRQYIEGYNVADLVGTTFTLSFWVKSSKTGVHCVGFRNSAPDRSYVAEYTVTSANTWEYKTITVANGLPASGTWNFTNGLGLAVIWTLMAGINTQTTPNAWQTGNFFATSAQVNCVDDTANNFYLTGVQLEAGPTATPFERRPYSVELGMAMRYYQKLQPTHTAYFNSGTDVLGTLPYLVPTRAPAGVSFLGSVANVSINRAGNSGVPVSSFTSAVDAGAVSAQLRYALATAGTTGQGTLVFFGGDAYVQINAEL